MTEHCYYVYMLSSSTRRVLYTGVARSLATRLVQRRAGESEFTAKYKAFRLVYFEQFEWIQNAIDREKQIKGWKRQRKEELVRGDQSTVARPCSTIRIGYGRNREILRFAQDDRVKAD
ncbi:MAG: GIY-YIG nuclease family protein [Acidobacteriaceae bacterium]